MELMGAIGSVFFCSESNLVCKSIVLLHELTEQSRQRGRATAGNAQQIAREAGVGEVDRLIDPAPYQARVTTNVSGLVSENAMKGWSEQYNTKEHPRRFMNHRSLSFTHHARAIALWAFSILLIKRVVV